VDIGTGVAFAGVAFGVISSIGLAAWHVSGRLARMEGKLENGLSAALKALWHKVDELPCNRPHCPVEED